MKGTKENCELLKSLIQPVPVVSVTLGDFGGDGLFITLGFDPKETWANNIFQNSRHAMFSADEGKIEMFSATWRELPKFRKCKAVTIQEVADRINKFIELVSAFQTLAD